MTISRYWGWTLTAAVAVSVAGNVGHALLTATPALRGYAAVAAALPPLALLVVTEGLAHSVGHGVRRWTYRAGMAGAVVIALLAFVLSFAALRDLAIALGQPAVVAAGWPLLADATIAVSSVMLLAVRPVATTTAGKPAATTSITADTVSAPVTPGGPATGTASAADPVADSHHPVGTPPGAAHQPVPAPTVNCGDAVARAELHLVTGDDGASGVADHRGGGHDRHMMVARAALAAGVVVKPAAPVVAEALRLRDAGESQRAVAAQLGIDRSVVARLEAFAAEQEAVV